MCGRYTLFGNTNSEEIRKILNILQKKQGGPIRTGEIFPTNKAPVLLLENNKVQPELITWGFPSFRGKGVIINARAETLQEKRMFRNPLVTGRCVIPSTGFYEWSHDSQKQKYLFNVPAISALYMAGLYARFDSEYRFVIITVAANADMLPVHNRMPLVLTHDGVSQWIRNQEQAVGLLNSVPSALTKYMPTQLSLNKRAIFV